MKNKLFTLLAALALLVLPSSALAAPYLYVSHKYDYSIECPQKPLGVIPLLDEEHPGEMLVFKNDGYTILRAWIISTGAFSAKDMPDFNKMTPTQEKDYASILAANRGYQQVRFVPLHGKKIIYAVTPKIVYISSEKDGKKEEIAKNVAQRIEAYVPGRRTNYAIVFMNTGEPDAAQINAYQEGLISFKEINLPKGQAKEKALQQEKQENVMSRKEVSKPSEEAQNLAPEAKATEQPGINQVKTELGNTSSPTEEKMQSETVEPSAVMK